MYLHYWSNDEDLGISIAENCMTRNNSETVKNFVRYARAEKNKKDKGIKKLASFTIVKLKFYILENMETIF